MEFFILRTGVERRNLSRSYPPWEAVYYYFDKWKKNGTFERINDRLNQLDREREGMLSFPEVLYIDYHSIKLHPMIFEDRGLDSNKQVNGRKR